MERESLQSPGVVAKQLLENKNIINDLGRRFINNRPAFVVTCARGSSDHAAAYAKYLFEINLGIPVLSLGPSIGSVYCRKMSLHNSLFLVVSQSGQSPDLVACSRWAKENGAFVVALVNENNTPLHDIADQIIPIHAGREQSVAATKSYIGSLAAMAQLVAVLSGDQEFAEMITKLPEDLEKNCCSDWSRAVTSLADANDLLVVGRGVAHGITLEAALKFKETSAIHAEGFSSAELMHGPMALICRDYPVLVFSQDDETSAGTRQLVQTLRDKGARAFIVQQEKNEIDELVVVGETHSHLAPIMMIQRFYLLVNEIAILRGYDPDHPRHLQKVTETK